jgi:hypothetical protein
MSKARRKCANSVALAGLLCAAPCLAVTPLTPLLACRALTDGAARLACFDRESAKLVPAGSLVPPSTSGTGAAATPLASAAVQTRTPVSPPAASITSSPAPLSNPKDNFGLPDATVAKKEVAAGMRPADLANIEAHLKAFSVSSSGQTTFTLDNGQVWRQLLSEGDLFAKPGDGVTISRGFLNSYWLKLKSGRGCKVTRIL